MAHKLFEAITMGISYVKAGLSVLKDRKMEAIFFILATPIGMLIGIYLRQNIAGVEDADDSIYTGIILALSSGTFIYIALIEVLTEEFGHQHSEKDDAVSRVIKFSCFLFGVGVLGFIALYT